MATNKSKSAYPTLKTCAPSINFSLTGATVSLLVYGMNDTQHNHDHYHIILTLQKPTVRCSSAHGGDPIPSDHSVTASRPKYHRHMEIMPVSSIQKTCSMSILYLVLISSTFKPMECVFWTIIISSDVAMARFLFFYGWIQSKLTSFLNECKKWPWSCVAAVLVDSPKIIIWLIRYCNTY